MNLFNLQFASKVAALCSGIIQKWKMWHTSRKASSNIIKMSSKACNPQGHSSLTPIYLYSYRMTFDVMRLDIAIYKDTVPWPLYISTFRKKPFDVWWVKMSYPQIHLYHDVEWRRLNPAFRYEVKLTLSASNVLTYFRNTGIAILGLKPDRQLQWHSHMV